MSAAYAAPDPDDRRDTPSGDAELSDRDRRILDEIAGHENGADPTFVARLREPARPASPATERVLQVLAVAAVLAVLLPTAWVMVGVVVLVIGVLPAVLGWAVRRSGQAGGPAKQ